MGSEPKNRPDVVFLSGIWGNDKHEIHCPRCGESYVYPLFRDMRSDETDDYTSPAGERGSWVEIPMACEQCNHEGEEGFSVVLAFHKGGTFLTVLGPPPDWDNPDLPGPHTPDPKVFRDIAEWATQQRYTD